MFTFCRSLQKLLYQFILKGSPKLVKHSIRCISKMFPDCQLKAFEFILTVSFWFSCFVMPTVFICLQLFCWKHKLWFNFCIAFVNKFNFKLFKTRVVICWNWSHGSVVSTTTYERQISDCKDTIFSHWLYPDWRQLNPSGMSVNLELFAVHIIVSSFVSVIIPWSRLYIVWAMWSVEFL